MKKWELKQHSWQIADTGDYDGHAEITNGTISFFSRSDDDEGLAELVACLNQYGLDLHQDDKSAYELFLAKKEIRELKKRLESSEFENLTKENFFNDLYEKYPKSMKLFCDWIDECKIKNNWDKLFNSIEDDFLDIHIKSPKFHEIPIAMQFGIMNQFINEQIAGVDEKGMSKIEAGYFYSMIHALEIKTLKPLIEAPDA